MSDNYKCKTIYIIGGILIVMFILNIIFNSINDNQDDYEDNKYDYGKYDNVVIDGIISFINYLFIFIWIGLI